MKVMTLLRHHHNFHILYPSTVPRHALGIALRVCFVFFIFYCSSCSDDNATNGNDTPVKTNDFLVDSLATPETVALFTHLQELAQTNLLFGHQDATAYGVNWSAENGRSDVKDVCGDFPAVYGWDLGDIQFDANLDGVSFLLMRNLIGDACFRGGINTISMHLDNPYTGGDAWDNAPAVRYILPGGSHHLSYLHTLDLVANFLKGLKTSQGVHIPVILRPYHEHNHSWPWWGRSSCTVDEYNSLWRMTVEYLRDKHKIHHLLYAISPQEISAPSHYLERYPGDGYVDILGLDYYKLYDKANIPDLGNALNVVATLARERGKVAALTEVGYDKIPVPDWWTAYLLAAIRSNPDAEQIAWALVWRNASTSHFFAPYPGQSSARDFIIFYNESFTLFESDLPDMYH